MEWKTEDLLAAQQGRHVKIQASGQKYYTSGRGLSRFSRRLCGAKMGLSPSRLPTGCRRLGYICLARLPQANDHTFYLLSQRAYEELEEVNYEMMDKAEMDLLADETHALISEEETDEY